MLRWWAALGTDLLIPLLMIIIGIILCKYPPRKINRFYGYRTSLSRKNMETWIFANKYCGKITFLVGLISFIPSALILLPFYLSSEKVITIVMFIVVIVQIGMVLGTIIATEIALKKEFNRDGSRREKPEEKLDK